MVTIVAPKKIIDDLWSKPKARDGVTFRLMRYVLRVDYDGKVLLHNAVTGKLAVLNQDETKALNNLPMSYDPVIEALVDDHYIVSEDYDECQQVMNLRTVLRKLKGLKYKQITTYTILPTTACNARCYYCFEHGVKPVTMTEQTASQLVEFIANNCGVKKVANIVWFGGEPSIASNRIDQICEGLRAKGITYHSTLITNGYIFDEALVDKAVSLWNVEALQICVDGVGDTYNTIKAYVTTGDNPYERVMRNIGLFLDKGILTELRMNFDIDNYHEFVLLAKDVVNRFGRSEKLHLGFHPVIGEYKGPNGKISHGTDSWFSEKMVELREISRNYGLDRSVYHLPSLKFNACSACDTRAITIRADGGLVKCPEHFGDEEVIGSVQTGIVNYELAASWNEYIDYPMCMDCRFFPNCLRLKKCSNKGYCHKFRDYLLRFEETVKSEYKQNNGSIGKGDGCNVF